MPLGPPSFAQPTWKDFAHFPLVHCIGAPWALCRAFEQAAHFCNTRILTGGAWRYFARGAPGSNDPSQSHLHQIYVSPRRFRPRPRLPKSQVRPWRTLHAPARPQLQDLISFQEGPSDPQVDLVLKTGHPYSVRCTNSREKSRPQA